jgi:hypothetical protein
MAGELTNLEQLLDRMGQAAEDRERITLADIMEAVGSRSFGPLLLLAGVITLSPASGIPGVPTAMAVFLLLIAAQLLFHKQHFWLPDLLLRRSLPKNKYEKALAWMRPLARWVDRWLRPRLQALTHGPGVYFVAIVCIIIAACMPVMELIPFTATSAGAALTAFGLSLISRDGLWAVFALMMTGTVLGLIFLRLF